MEILFGENMAVTVFLASDTAVTVSGGQTAEDTTDVTEGTDEADTSDTAEGTDSSLTEDEVTASPDTTSESSDNEYYVPDGSGDTQTYDDTGSDTGFDESMAGVQQDVKDPLLSKGLFVGGVSAAVFVVGGLLGLLLALKKIKKGIDPYEDF